MSAISKKNSILDRPLSRVKAEINMTTFAFLFSEIVSYCEKRSTSSDNLHSRLHSLGYEVGTKILDVNYMREKGYKREVNLQRMLLFLKTNVWKSLFGKEADGLNSDEQNVYYIIEKDPLVNMYISLHKGQRGANCAAFTAGIIEAFLRGSNYNATVTAHWHNGTTYRIEFDEETLARASQV